MQDTSDNSGGDGDESGNWIAASVRDAPYEVASLLASHVGVLGFGFALGVAVYRVPIEAACQRQAQGPDLLTGIDSTCSTLGATSNTLMLAGMAVLVVGVAAAVVGDVLEGYEGSVLERAQAAASAFADKTSDVGSGGGGSD